MRLLSALILAFLLTPVGQSLAQGNTLEERFLEANRAYRAGKYEAAAKGYETLPAQGLRCGHLYYNLGNAYFRLHRLGKAILSYERAAVLIPRDADLRFNLAQARQQVVDAVPEEGSFLDSAFFWVHALTLREILWGFALLNALFWGLLLVRLFQKKEWTFYALLLVLVPWLLGGASLGLKWVRVSWDHRAVVLERVVPVRAGPGEGDTVLFRLHEGSVVRWERDEGSWRLIRLGDRRRGWVPGSAVEPIRVE